MKFKNIVILVLFLIISVHADMLKENFIVFDLNGSQPTALVDFESDNLEKFIELDDNRNGIVSWKEIRTHRKAIETFVLSHIDIRIDGKACPKSVAGFEVYRRGHQSYIRMPLKLACALPIEAIDLKYDLFFDVDKDQKAFVRLKEQNGTKPVILSSRKVEVVLKMENQSLWRAFVNFLTEGIWHIWMGFDHILFLLMLLIPSVYIYRGRRAVPRASFREILIEVLKIVTAFSVAHSLTLALSVSGLVEVNSMLIEVLIALTVLFTALNNLYPVIRHSTWMMAFGFGLIHGFGFANVLRELMVKNGDFVAMLLGFNLGVEIGQLAIVTALLPILYWLRKSRFYHYAVLYGVSAVTAVIALLWAIERAFD